ncbi:MAG: LysR family transcriptional regulator [Polyangiaceae bacterium]
MDNGPTLELLQDFDALFRERQLTRAALRTGRSQPAMSRSLQRLRELFADALFVRTSQGMLPTPRAEALAPRVESVLEGARALVTKATFDPRTLVRTFTIGASDLVDADLLASLAAAVSREAPLVDIVSMSARDVGTTALADGRVDLWVGTDESVPVGSKRQHLFDDAFQCAVRANHPVLDSDGARKRPRARQSPPRPLSVEAYVSLAHIQIAPRGTSGGPVDTALEKLGLSRRVAVRTTSFLSAPWIASRSDMILTGPSRLLRALAEPFDLVTFAPPIAIPGFRIFQAWHPRVHDDAAHRWFRGLLRAEAAK